MQSHCILVKVAYNLKLKGTLKENVRNFSKTVNLVLTL